MYAIDSCDCLTRQGLTMAAMAASLVATASALAMQDFCSDSLLVSKDCTRGRLGSDAG